MAAVAADQVTRLSPSISNFQLCSPSCSSEFELILGKISEGGDGQQLIKYDSYLGIRLVLDSPAPTVFRDVGAQEFQILVRVHPTPSGRGPVQDLQLRPLLLMCDVRVRHLRMIGAEANVVFEGDDPTIGYHIEDMLTPKSEYKCSSNQNHQQVELFKSTTIRSMTVFVIVRDLCDIPEKDTISWILTRQKIYDILSTYDLHVKPNTLIDLRECPLADSSSIAFLFIRNCAMKNTTESNLIGRIGVNTKITIDVVHDLDYYQRKITSTRLLCSPRIFDFESTNSTVYINLRATVRLQQLMAAAAAGFPDRNDAEEKNKFWTGILLAGPSGCGKNMLVQELSRGEAVKLIQFNFASELIPSSASNSIIEGAYGCQKLTSVFDQAIQSSKRYATILLLQQIHVLDTGGATSTKSANTKMKLVVHLCRLFDKISKASSSTPLMLTVIGTTGQPHLVCTQLRMRGRFEQEIFMSLPTESERVEILKFLVRNMGEFKNIDLSLVAKSTPGYTRAELVKLVHSVRIKCMSLEKNEYNFVELANIEACIKNIHPTAMKGFLVDAPNVKWEDIGGQKDLKFKLKQSIEWPLKHDEAFKRMGISPPRGVLMYGPPGCSKTMIAKALASECGVNFFSVNGSELFSQWVGDSEKAVESLFREARQVSPCIIFFDEIDSIVGERGSTSKGASSVHERVIAQLLVEIDGVESLKGVTIIAATNRPDMIDPALLRPGRLDRIVYVPLPDAETRRDIFGIHFRRMPVPVDINLDKLVELTNGYSGAEVAALCHEAALKSLEEDLTAERVQFTHFEQALQVIRPGTTQEQITMYENYNKNQQS